MIHLPPYHKIPTWQRFFAGVFFGAIIAYIVLLYMYGSMYEDLLIENSELQSQVSELENQNEALLEDREELNEPLTVETIEITITNAEELRMDRLIVHQLEELMKEEINHLVGAEVSNLANSDQLILSTIENKEFAIDDFSYYFDVSLLIIGPRVDLNVEARLTN